MGEIDDFITDSIENEFGLRNPCQIEIAVSMNDIVRDLNDSLTNPSVSVNSAGDPTSCPNDSPYSGYRMLITGIVDTATNSNVSNPLPEYAYSANGDLEIHSSAVLPQYLGDYEVSFVVGLSKETDAQLLTSSLVQTISLLIILDEC